MPRASTPEAEALRRQRISENSAWRRGTQNRPRIYTSRADNVRDANIMQLARQRGFEIREYVRFLDVCTRDHMTCQICHELVDLTLDSATHPMSATLDHLEPIHAMEFVRLAHRTCNDNTRPIWSQTRRN